MLHPYNCSAIVLPARFQPDVDVRDDVTRLATLGPALVLAAVAVLTAFVVIIVFARLPQTAHRDALAARGREDADDIIVAAPGPDDAIRPRALHAVHRPAPRHEHLARHDHDAIDGHDILVLARLGVDVLRAGVSPSPSHCAARETQPGREGKQLTFHRAHLLVKVMR